MGESAFKAILEDKQNLFPCSTCVHCKKHPDDDDYLVCKADITAYTPPQNDVLFTNRESAEIYDSEIRLCGERTIRWGVEPWLRDILIDHNNPLITSVLALDGHNLTYCSLHKPKPQKEAPTHPATDGIGNSTPLQHATM